jgi:Tfp pilus assembly protein PilF
VSDQLQKAIALIKSGDKQNGKQLLTEILKTESQNEAAWLWMSSVVDKDEEQRY